MEKYKKNLKIKSGQSFFCQLQNASKLPAKLLTGTV
jgi:hypothetical protein